MKFVCCVSFSKDTAETLFTPWELGSFKKSKYWFGLSVVTFGWYLFKLIALLKLDFHCSSRFALSFVDKITTGT